jgi:hypothetical protein
MRRLNQAPAETRRAVSVCMVTVAAMQVREQEHQRKRQRPDKRSNPRPDFEAASTTLCYSTGKIDRTDKHDQGDGVHDARSNAALRCIQHGVGGAAAGRQGLKFQAETLPIAHSVMHRNLPWFFPGFSQHCPQPFPVFVALIDPERCYPIRPARGPVDAPRKTALSTTGQPE